MIRAGFGNDALTGGEGADDILGGAGADSIILTESTPAADIVCYTALTELVVAGTASGDTITGFGLANDTIRFTSGGTFDGAIDDVTADNTIAWNSSAIDNTTTAINAGTAEAILLTDAAGTLALTNLTNVATLLNAELTITTTGAAGADEFLIAVQSGGQTGIYLYTEASAAAVNTVTAGELQLVGVVDALLATGNFSIA